MFKKSVIAVAMLAAAAGSSQSAYAIGLRHSF